jgi:hypothetical protein
LSNINNKPLLYNYFETSANLMLSEYERSKLQRASTNLGNNRELFCNVFLSRVLPTRLKVRKGEIWDGQDHKTGQLDTIIVRDDTPSLIFGESNTYLAEGIFSVIEIKSNLSRQKLREAIETLAPVASLVIYQEGVSILGGPPEAVLERPLRCVFAYEGATWETLIDEVEKQNGWDVIDILCILNRGALVRNGLFFKWQEDVIFGIFKGKAAALGLPYFFLATYATSFIARSVSVRPYFEPFVEWSEDGKCTVAHRKNPETSGAS